MRQKVLGARTIAMSYNSANRLSSYTDSTGPNKTLGYDARGNVTTLGSLAFTYDMADQPRAVTGGTYAYDGNMKRARAYVNAGTIYNVYDSAGSLVHVDDVTANKTTDYVSGPNGSLARITNGVVTYLHNDHLGTSVTGTNTSGSVLWREDTTPFGITANNPAANDNLAGFTGHIRDSATGLNYMQARYYDPVIGRFLSVDPLGFMQTGEPGMFNRYAYTFNNPVNLVDPLGMAPSSIKDEIAGRERISEDSCNCGMGVSRNSLRRILGFSGEGDGSGGKIERKKGKKPLVSSSYDNPILAAILTVNFGSSNISYGNNELSHARNHSINYKKLSPKDGIFHEPLNINNDVIYKTQTLLLNAFAAPVPNFQSSEGSRTIAVNFYGPSLGYGNLQSHELGVTTPVTQVLFGPDKWAPGGNGARFITSYPINVDQTLSGP